MDNTDNQLQTARPQTLQRQQKALLALLANLPEAESQIIQRKYSAKPVCKLTTVEMQATCQALGIRVAIITGWQLPEAALQKIFWDQMGKYLIEQYPTLNHEEIEYAFRTKSSNIKDWGKSMNLSLFTEVLEPYIAERRAASIIEAQQTAKLEDEQKQLPPEKLTNAERIEFAYGHWKLMDSWEFIMVGTYEALKSEGRLRLTRDEQEPYYSAAKAIANQKEDKDREYFSNLDREYWLKSTARKLAVAKYFEGLLRLESK